MRRSSGMPRSRRAALGFSRGRSRSASHMRQPQPLNCAVMPHSALSPCPGCGALFPPHDGPTHRYLGASAGCWALFGWSVVSGGTDVTGLIAQSRIPDNVVLRSSTRRCTTLDSLWGDAYGVQHHGGTSPQAVQSVAVHLLNLHGIINGKTTRPGWPIERALRTRGVSKARSPTLGSALTFRASFPRWRSCHSGHAQPVCCFGLRSMDGASSFRRGAVV